MKMLKLGKTYLNLDHVRKVRDTSEHGRVKFEVYWVGSFDYQIFHSADAEIIRKWVQEQTSG